MTSQRIILQPRNQAMTLSLPSGDYRLTIRWYDSEEAGWTLDLADPDGTPLLSTIPLVTGADLLAQHRHLGLDAQLIVASDSQVDRVPGFADLGVSTQLYVITP